MMSLRKSFVRYSDFALTATVRRRLHVFSRSRVFPHRQLMHFRKAETTADTMLKRTVGERRQSVTFLKGLNIADIPLISERIWSPIKCIKLSKIRKNKRRLQKKDALNLFSEMVYCADCGAKMYLSRRVNERPEQEHMRCSTYAKNTKECTVHYIRTCILREIVLG